MTLAVTRLGVRAPVQRKPGRKARAKPTVIGRYNESENGKELSNLCAARAFHNFNCARVGWE